jgi:triacylglycerol lipase
VNEESKLNALKQQAEKTEEQWRQRWQTVAGKVKKGSDRGLSMLNGVVGDYLEQKGVAIAVQMSFCLDHKPLTMDASALKLAYPQATGKLCIMLHGLGCNESVWTIDDAELAGKMQRPQGAVGEATYASLLGDELGYTPMYVRYNTGLHISHNGQMLAEMLSQLLAVYPVPIEEIVFINHSMGGLVARSACFYGSKEDTQQQQSCWVDKVRQLYFLGSPHLGADLEKFGNVVTNALKSAPLPYTSLVADILNTRSAGIKDLRYGYVKDEDWQGQDPDDLLNNNKETVPLLDTAAHFVVTGTIHKDSNHVLSQWFGDALVRKNSATGQSRQEAHNLPFLPEHHKEFVRIHHVKLAHCWPVYEQIRDWISIN